MERSIKILTYWLILGVGMILFNMGAIVGVLLNGNVNIINIIFMVSPFIFVIGQLNTSERWFKRASLIWSCILLILNIIRLFGGPSFFLIPFLLLLVTNVLLTMEISKEDSLFDEILNRIKKKLDKKKVENSDEN